MNDSDTDVSGGVSSGEVGLVQPEDFHSGEPFAFSSGEALPELTVRYETYGTLNRECSNAVLICHALSGDHHCAGIHTLEDRKPGWWNHFIGPGKAVDTGKYFVICSNCLGGCQGTTGPSSLDPRTGKPYGSRFPLLTIGDMVRAQALLLDHLGIEKLHAAIGGSMGGMQVLQWAVEHPERVDRIIPLATTARQGAQAIAFDEVGRQAILQDPRWSKGEYEPGNGPDVGLAVARMMAHITYLSDQGMDEKFGRARQELKGGKAEDDKFGVEFEVESYLRYQGKSFVTRFDANTYLFFTKALNRFDLYSLHPSGRLESVFEQVGARALVIGFESDWLFPPEQNREIVRAMLRAGKAASYAELKMAFGHDSFLLHSPELYALVSAFLDA